MPKILNTVLGFVMSIAIYREYVGLGVAVLTGIYMIIQICIGWRKLMRKKIKDELE